MAELQVRGFEGSVSVTPADLTVFGTDNSIYQVSPDAVAFPRTTEDLVRIARLISEPRFRTLALRPRGGGTGTNGQSLGGGVVVDTSRYMNGVIEINAKEGWARVQSGVVKDQLEAALLPYGLFFPPELSTSNRATIGGMISTDACGQGSCLYGKTSNYVLELTTVLSDGTVWRSKPLDDDELALAKAQPDRVGEIHRTVDDIQRRNAELIDAHFPKLNRYLTGYDLAHIRREPGLFDLSTLICGSEGTLALIAEAKVRIVPIPAVSALVVVVYADFDTALRDATELMKVGASSIETIDSKVLELARGDLVWHEVRDFFPATAEPARGVNFVEFVGNDAAEVEGLIERAVELIADRGASVTRLGHHVVRGEGVESIWRMRKKAVGLLGNVQGDRRPVAFVEDTAVPPERLADYIAEFRAALDRRGLDYGMFGHVDAGVLHVRPGLNLKDPDQEILVRQVTEEVVALTRKYGGLLWGEHGKGVRSEFVPDFFGPLYPALVAVKTAFDPFDQLNPGKIASPGGGALTRIDDPPLRGQLDRTIPQETRRAYDEALHCNGNGACYDWDPDQAMCPSWKATRERRHSPKGRSALVREWLRLLAAAGTDPRAESERIGRGGVLAGLGRSLLGIRRRADRDDFSHAVKEAMDGCLACKSCVGQCPIKVDVPTFRSKFLQLYYDRYPRPLKDYLLATLEPMTIWLSRFSGIYNALLARGPGAEMLKLLGMVHSPQLSRLDLSQELAKRQVRVATPDALRASTPEERARSVVLVQDAFTSFYDTPVFLAFVDLVHTVGCIPWVAPFRANGKPMHVIGMLGPFERLARRNAAELAAMAETGVPLVGVDPSMTLTYRSEYVRAVGRDRVPPVLLVQEWLATLGAGAAPDPSDENYWLLPHCTERTNAPGSLRDWERAFEAFGLSLTILPSGCCGMAGTFGHERANREMSERIYASSWSRHVADEERAGRLMATGYSCRSQAKIISASALPHPVQVLLDALRTKAAPARVASP